MSSPHQAPSSLPLANHASPNKRNPRNTAPPPASANHASPNKRNPRNTTPPPASDMGASIP